MKGLATGAPLQTCAQLGSVAATFALEHLGRHEPRLHLGRVPKRGTKQHFGALTSSRRDQDAWSRRRRFVAAGSGGGRRGSHRQRRAPRSALRSTCRRGLVCHQRDDRSFHTARREVARLRPMQRSVSGRAPGRARRARRQPSAFGARGTSKRSRSPLPHRGHHVRARAWRDSRPSPHRTHSSPHCRSAPRSRGSSCARRADLKRPSSKLALEANLDATESCH